MNILVVGGAGYIGSHCVRQIVAAGHKPVVLDNLSYGHRSAVPAGITFIQGEMADQDLVRQTLREQKIDVVMHFAAFINVGESVQQPLKYYQNNFVATLRLLEAMLAEKVMKFVFSSTCATYGVPERMPMTEDLPQHPINPYGQTKLDVENLLKSLATAHGLSFAAFRYFNASGAADDATIGEDHSPETHLIPLAIAAALGRGPALQVFGDDYPTPDGTCLRDYIHVDDLSRAHIAAFDKLNKPGTQLFYNLGTGKPTSVREILGAVERATGKPVPHTIAPRRAGDPPALYADSTKAQKELGWKPVHTSTDSIVASAVKWHQGHLGGYADR
jgi:UDP-glucose 4-epimerase